MVVRLLVGRLRIELRPDGVSLPVLLAPGK